MSDECSFELEKMDLLMNNEVFEGMSDQAKSLQILGNIYSSLPLKKIKLINMKEGDDMTNVIEKFKNIWHNHKN